jgi:phosphoglycolate phosphatase-like HAD superfamily hydrolase
VVTGSDARATKPDPDLVIASVRRLRLPAAQCAMVGDTPHDGEACARAGVRFLALTCGGHDEETLRRAGAVGVWADPSALLAELDLVLSTEG